MWKEDGKGNYIFGEYALTGVNNAFNNRKSYWISKDGCMLAFYCFTFWDNKNLEDNLKDPKIWIDFFEERIKRFWRP